MTTARTRRVLGAPPAIALALAVAVTSLLPVSPARAAAPTTGITGSVTEAGRPPGQAAVRIVPVDPAARVGFDDGYRGTDETGHFAFALSPGRYWVQFVDVGYAREWWGDAPTRGASTEVVVTDGALTELDPVLERGGSISGAVPQAVPTQGDFDAVVEVLLPDATYTGGYVLMGLSRVGADGTYRISELPASDDYVVHARLASSSLEGWWDGATTAESSTPVRVDPPIDTTGISLTGLGEQGLVTGVVRRGDGKRLAGIDVLLFRRDEDGEWVQGPGTFTNAQGGYGVQVPAGAYRILFTGAGVRPRSTTTDTVVAVDTRSDVDASLLPTALVGKAPPSVRGARVVGSTLSVSGGEWYPTAGDLAYQWLRDGHRIAGAARPTYRLTADDQGRRLSVKVTASRTGYESASVVAPVRGTIAGKRLQVTRPARLTGRLVVGGVLSATPPLTRPGGVSVRYRWLSEGLRRGETGARYHLRRLDGGHQMSVVITVTRRGYEPLVRTVTRTDDIVR